MKDNLNNEQKLLLLAGRYTFSENEVNELRELVNNELDWSLLYGMAIRHKMLSLLWYNLNKYCPKIRINSQYRQVANFHYMGTKLRNEEYLKNYNKIRMACKERGVYIYPTKGGYLLPELYKDFGVRTINDVDSLVRAQDIQILRNVLNSLGYIEGEYDRTTKEIKPVVRQKQIMWAQKSSNLFPFQKISNSPYIEHFDYDFCYSFNRSTAPVTDIINRSVKEGLKYLKHSDFFVHLCYHLFREASSAVAILYQVDINIIKFCDIREFLINKMNKNDCLEAINFAKKYELENSLYYTLHYLIEMYNDEIAKWMFEELNMSNTEILKQYGNTDFMEPREWSKSFWVRLFANNNKDEIKDIPNFISNVYKYY
mgnify:CR=1 FL=1